MVKDFDYVLDLAKIPPIALADAREDVRAIARACRAGRAVPLLPATFSDRLASKSFTSKKADLHVVSSIYAEGYRMRMASSKLFNYTGLQWGDEELTSLAQVLWRRPGAGGGALPEYEPPHRYASPSLHRRYVPPQTGLHACRTLSH